jgi:hypothetical protein
MYKVVQIWPGLIVYQQVTVCPGHIWTTLYVSPQINSQFPYWPLNGSSNIFTNLAPAYTAEDETN